MAEDFPSYRHEDSDDDTPAPRSVDHSPRPPASAPERPHAPAMQEGTIFSRDTIAPELSRPLFDFIRKSEQRAPRPEASAAPSAAEALPSVSVPGEPEVRTYQPPVDAEMTQAIHERAAEDDDDDEDEGEDDDARQVVPADAAAAPVPDAAPLAEQQRPLNEQFEELMRAEMGEDFARLTSAEHLGHEEPDEPDDEPSRQPALAPVAAPARPAASRRTPSPVPVPVPGRAPAPEWSAPAMPEFSSSDAATESDELEATAGGTPEETAVAAGDAEIPSATLDPEAFYYAEDTPEPPDAVTPAPAAGGAGGPATGSPRAAYGGPTGPMGRGGSYGSSGGSGGSGRARGGGTPPPPPTPPVGGGFASGGPGGPTNMNAFAMAPNLAPPLAYMSNLGPNRVPRLERRENHNGRWFIAGVLTGWLLKQHFANKKLRSVEKTHQQAAEKLQEKVDAAEYTQYHLSQKLKRTEGQLRETQTTQAAQAVRSAEATRAAQQQAERAQIAVTEMQRQAQLQPVAFAAERSSAAGSAPVAVEQLRAAQPPRAAEATSVPLTAYEAVAAPAQIVVGGEQQSTAALAGAEQGRPNAPTPAVEQRLAAASAEMPLQYAAAAGAEASFVGAASRQAGAGSAEAPRAMGGAFSAEGVPANLQAVEQAPQTPQQVAAELVAKAYDLQPGQHIEHATGGGHNIIVDSHGHEVQNAMTYGEEFHFQRRQEQARAGSSGGGSNGGNGGSSGGASSVSGGGASDMYSPGIITGLASGQVPSEHQLPAGLASPAAQQHLLRSKTPGQNPVAAAVASPWLWASLIVLIAAFFVAAFI